MNKFTATTAGLIAGLTLGLTGSATADDGPTPPACDTVEDCRAGLGYWYDVATTYEWSMDVAAGRERALAVEVDEVREANVRARAQIERQADRLDRKDARIARLLERLASR